MIKRLILSIMLAVVFVIGSQFLFRNLPINIFPCTVTRYESPRNTKEVRHTVCSLSYIQNPPHWWGAESTPEGQFLEILLTLIAPVIAGFILGFNFTKLRSNRRESNLQ